MNLEIKTIDEYIEVQPDEIRLILQKVRSVIQDAAPEATEKISYGMPTFFLHGNLLHFAANKHHLGFYPAPSGLQAFPMEIAKYKSSKGAVQFPYNQPIPYDLIAEIVKFRVVENLEKAALKNSKGSKLKL
jgi:uncharacterized protein YdhG (YjbR/CyaY superfamily)